MRVLSKERQSRKGRSKWKTLINFAIISKGEKETLKMAMKIKRNRKKEIKKIIKKSHLSDYEHIADDEKNKLCFE